MFGKQKKPRGLEVSASQWTALMAAEKVLESLPETVHAASLAKDNVRFAHLSWDPKCQTDGERVADIRLLTPGHSLLISVTLKEEAGRWVAKEVDWFEYFSEEGGKIQL